MRSMIQRRIEALHVEIARLIEVEKRWQHKRQPASNDFIRHINDARVEIFRYPPDLRIKNSK